MSQKLLLSLLLLMLILMTRYINEEKNMRVEAHKITKMGDAATLGICALARREDFLIVEWIEYHHILGFENFYLYLPASAQIPEMEFNIYRSLLLPLKQRPEFKLEILVQDINASQPQVKVYQDCHHRFSEMNDWLFFIDVDEFLVPKSHNTMQGYLQSHPSYLQADALMFPWKEFVAKGFEDHTKQTRRSEE